MKRLVTGGAGYIGSIAIEEVLTAGYDVVVVDHLSQGHRAAVHPDAAFVQGDLHDRSAPAWRPGHARGVIDHDSDGVGRAAALPRP